MCWVLYLASDVPLPTIRWDSTRPAFNVEALPRSESRVLRQFSRRHIYIVGSHTLCGCGFDRAQANPDHPEELQQAEQSLRSLQEYLRRITASAREIELYSCWDGDQAADPDHRLVLAADDVSPTMPWFSDRTYAVVSHREA
jgi:hypothetical protein